MLAESAVELDTVAGSGSGELAAAQSRVLFVDSCECRGNALLLVHSNTFAHRV